MKTKQRIIKVVTSEVEIVTRHYTYEVVVDENMTEEFIETMDNLYGYSEIYDELNKHKYKFISRQEGKQYSADDNNGEIAEIELLNQPTWNLK